MKKNKKEAIYHKFFTDGQVQLIINKICNELNIPEMLIEPLPEERARKERADGIYVGKKRHGAYTTLLKNENDMHVALHELCHHVQLFFYQDTMNTPHDYTFSLAAKRIQNAVIKLFGKEYFPGHCDILRSCYI